MAIDDAVNRVLADIGLTLEPPASDGSATWDPISDEATALAAQHSAVNSSGPTSIVDRLQHTLLTTAAIKALPPPEWLIEGYLVRDSLAMLYGPSGTYKTFLGLDLALHVATGSWWNRHEIISPGPVLYVVAEGAAGIGKRLDAWQTHHRIYDLDAHKPITWQPRAVNLFDRLEATAFVHIACELEPDLIVIDTLARCSVGAEENSAKDMGIIVESLDHLRRNTGACILSIHHTGKDTASGARGSSALRGAMDTELEMSVGDPLLLRVKKQKDAADSAQIHLAVLPSVESRVLAPTSNLAGGYEIDDRVLATLASLTEISVPGGVSNGDWLEASMLPKSTFNRHRALLISRDLVLNVGSPARPRYIPTDPEEATHAESA